MATDLVMPRLPEPQQQPAYQWQFTTPPLSTPYQAPRTAMYTPQISPLSTSGNASPVSPKSHITRPIRPLYMPAVLRPTEFPSKARPVTVRPEGDDGEERVLRSNASFISLAGLGALGRLSRRSTGDSGKFVDGEWNLDLFPKPTGVPTRQHWKPDPESTICDEGTCKKYFTYFTRRHHCRRCGNIFCDRHSAFEIPLDQDANYNPRGTPSRACAHCYAEFKEWRSRTNSQSSIASGDSNTLTDGGTPISPIVASPTKSLMTAKFHDTAASVPRDWNWSTF